MKKNILLIIISIFLWIIFLLPFSLFGILNTGNLAGLLFAAAMLLYGIFFGRINGKIKELWDKKAWKIIFSVCALVITAAMIFTATVTANMIIAANNPPQKETTVVVLGCKVNRNGPSLSLLKRLEAAYDYLVKNPDAPCILSGGQGADEPMSEAQAMKDWLAERGIEEERLYLEDKSTSTSENLRFSTKIIKKEGFPAAITIITNDFHQYRAKRIAEGYNIESYSISGETPIYLLPTYYIRELGGTLVEFLLDNGRI